MSQPSASPRPFDRNYELEHRYTRQQGRVVLSGVQALVRLPMLQRQRDRTAGLHTAGFISGYRGSPLGTYDLALWQARDLLLAGDIRFEPGVNEDLAATAVWGTQQVVLQPGPKVDGVFSIWYGKGPGVDRSTDPIKHGNYLGTARHGGVLALCGDDPGAKSSSIAHQSEHALVHCGVPILNPTNVQEYLDLGLAGFALSRFSGCWVGMKCLTDTVDSAASVEVGMDRVQLVEPAFDFPAQDHHITFNNLPLQIEAQLYQVKLPAAQAFVRANGLDRVVLDAPRPRLGIVTAGKATLDVRQALEELGLDAARCAELGLCLYKVAMTWPLEPQGARAFCRGLEEVLVVEEKRPLLENQLARLLYNLPERPRLLGKQDEQGRPLLPSEGELSPARVAAALRSWLARRLPEGTLRPPVELPVLASPTQLLRLPAFCSGCPHNTSTRLPEGSIAMGGIGCHGMATWMEGRRTFGATQMGGEGANWIGQAPFVALPHIFQNLGDGTYFHSGLLAVRAAVTAGVNITYKILVNGAVAMTGGQPIEGEPMEGEITCPQIAQQLAAEGVQQIAVVSNEPAKYPRGAFPKGVTIHHRDHLDAVQRRLRETPGVTALLYDQTCAAEARRLRRRGAFPDPDERIVINEQVCEGCGDCSVQSGCISIEPVETSFGRKRRINQSSCNKDYTCVKGYCPSFVSVKGGLLRQAAPTVADTAGGSAFRGIPLPSRPDTSHPFNVLLTGIGGTGVVTVGAILAMAAHLEGMGCSELDVTGLAQKNGAVSSHVRVADDPAALHATRIGDGAADLVLGCDIVVTTNFEHLPKLAAGRTTAVVNTHVAPTSDFASHADLDLRPDAMEEALRQAAGAESVSFLPATAWATALLGDAIATNMLLLGYAFQLGRVPVSLPALERAIALNGRAVEMNLRAFSWGRLAAHDPQAVERAVRSIHTDWQDGGDVTGEESLDALLSRRVEHLTRYQSRRYARRYQTQVQRVAEAERAVGDGSDALARAVARSYAKLLAYKDEYEVARLYTDDSFRRQIAQEFEGDYRLELHLAPQFLPRWLATRDARSGQVAKWRLGPWTLTAFKLLAKLKFLRGTPLDLLGRTAHRRMERQLIRDYETSLDEILRGLCLENRDVAVEIASLPELIRGFDTVKERSLEETRPKWAELMRSFRLLARPQP